MMHRLRRYDVFRFAQNDVAPLRSAMMRCLPLCACRHASFSIAVIIGRSPTSFAEGKHHSKNAPLSVDKSAFFVGGESEIRTHGTVLAFTRFPVVRLRPAQPSLQRPSYYSILIYKNQYLLRNFAYYFRKKMINRWDRALHGPTNHLVGVSAAASPRKAAGG